MHKDCMFCTGGGSDPEKRGTIIKLFAFASPKGVHTPPVASIRRVKGGLYEAALGVRRYHGKNRTQDGWTWLCVLGTASTSGRAEGLLNTLPGLREIAQELEQVRVLWRQEKAPTPGTS